MSGKTIAVGIGAFAVGAVGGFIVGRRLAIKAIENWANEEIAKVNEKYRGYAKITRVELNPDEDDPELKTGVFSTPAGAAKILIGEAALDPDQQALQEVGREKVNEMFVRNGYPPLDGFEEQSMNDKIETARSLETVDEAAEEGEGDPLEGVTAESIEKSIWENTARTGEIAVVTDAEEDVKPEEDGAEPEFMPRRHPDRPYVITETWYHGEDEYEKQELVYYEEDGVLCEPNDRIVPNKEEIVGEQNLHRFGIGTKDRNTVYIRSEKRKTDYEVIRNKGSYTQVVHGVPPQRESHTPRKMRDDGE